MRLRNAALLTSAAAVAGLAALLWRRSDGMDLYEKVVLITGGSRGLGLALARGFARRGAWLVLCARNEEELQRAKQDLASISEHVLTIVCDVSDRQQVERLIERAVNHYGRIDVLVNNAGIIHVGPIDTMTIEDFEQAMDVMFWGPVHTTLAALPQMRGPPRPAL